MEEELKGANRFDYEVLKLIRMTDDQMLQILEITLRAFIPMWEAQYPDFPSEEVINRFHQKFDLDRYNYQLVPLYNRYYNKEEIAGLISFYETPLGRKMNNNIPQIAQESLAAFQSWGVALIEKTANDMESLS